MINYRVENLEWLVGQLKKEGVTITNSIETVEYGKFVHILDLEGDKLELWEPNDIEFEMLGEKIGTKNKIAPEKFMEKIAQLNDFAYICSQIAAYMELRRDVFQAIADPTRRAIITLVALQAMTPSAIAERFDSSRQTISKHIQILAECELLEQKQTGREIYYYINAKKMKEVADFIEPFRMYWDDKFNKLEAIMKKYKTKK